MIFKPKIKTGISFIKRCPSKKEKEGSFSRLPTKLLFFKLLKYQVYEKKKIALSGQLGQVVGDLLDVLADGGHERLL